MNNFKGKIISFEPTIQAHKLLVQNSAKDPNWLVHKPVALGEKPGELEINITKNSVASSILPMEQSLAQSKDDFEIINKYSVEIITLDSIFDTYTKSGERNYLKIDTQGYEKNVLLGASNSLKKCSAVELELSLVPQYVGEETIDYYYHFMAERGFKLCNVRPVFVDKASKRYLQVDGIFVNYNLL